MAAAAAAAAASKTTVPWSVWSTLFRAQAAFARKELKAVVVVAVVAAAEAVNPLNGGGGGGGGAVGGGGGIANISQVTLQSTVSTAARTFFTTLGVNLTRAARKSRVFQRPARRCSVRATQDDLDTIEKAIQVLNQVAPQVHIKSRFIELVQQSDNKAFGLDWYLGNFINGAVVANGGSAPSLNVPVSAANPLGTFPGNTVASQLAE